ncbi:MULTISPECIES: YycH family regulatory protein [Rummeliibacillus]|uniref:YycH family regulatory protein n=1 Tax=Rummeliibacillus TaxID=648802 RepID=UPI0011B71D25|nr:MULTISPECIES: two-component system activity regulator YycH [Rummeliibacillus]
MGLKYIEQIKSVVLFVLVFLSITLTFSIWTYKPNYDTEKTKAVEMLIDKKTHITDIIKPYRMIFHENGVWRGTERFGEMKSTMEQMQNWRVTNPTLVSSNFNDAKMDQLVAEDKRCTLFFSAEIPYSIFQNILPTTGGKAPNISFNKMIISWKQLESSDELTVFFANTKKKQLYKAEIHVKNKSMFEKKVVNSSHSLEKYAVFTRDKDNALYLPAKESKMIQSAYIINNVSIDRFTNALFNNPKIVKNSINDANAKENYTDGVSMMTVDNNKRVLDFVNTAASDNHEVLEKSKLILSTFDFINEHGGWTGDFRYESLDYKNNRINYQLYVEDYPVYADSLDTSTQIVTVWGDNRIARYTRPFYKLVPSLESSSLSMMSGQEVINNLIKLKTVNFKDIEEIRSGYFLTKNGQSAFIFKPTWFYLANGKWSPLSSPTVGGGQVGLE